MFSALNYELRTATLHRVLPIEFVAASHAAAATLALTFRSELRIGHAISRTQNLGL